MSYMHIPNLYADPRLLAFRELYALEKIHGTSAHLTWKDDSIRPFSGGAKHETFVALFDLPALTERFLALGHADVTVFGEAYGGKLQGMSATYGKDLRFVAFEVRVGATWLTVPNALDVAGKLGLEFVAYERVAAEVEILNAERDRPSRQAKRNGIAEDKPAEGVVLRPLLELIDSRGERLIAKHKRAEFGETRTPREVDPEQAKVLEDAEAIALEWVTSMRLEHVLDKLGDVGLQDTGRVIAAMVEDVLREAGAEVVDSKPARKAIGAAAAKLFRAKLQASLSDGGAR